MNSCRGTCIKYEGRWLKIGTKTYSYDGNQTLLVRVAPLSYGLGVGVR